MWALILLCFLGFSCSKPAAHKASGDFSIPIPLQQSDGKFKIETVQLEGLQNLREMRGQNLEFFLNPRLKPGGLEGSVFNGRYAKMGDHWVARDVRSLTAAALYFHLQNLQKFDRQVKIPKTRGGPLQVALSVELVSGGEKMVNNAVYEGQSRAILFVPYQGKNFPISVNSGILAHEYFHSLFDPLVQRVLIEKEIIGLGLQADKSPVVNKFSFDGGLSGVALEKQTEKKPGTPPPTKVSQKQIRRLYHSLWIRGLNEGMADLWGWTYTKDPLFIARSLPSEKVTRALEGYSGVRLAGALTMKAAAESLAETPEDQRAGEITPMAYLIGTQWARFFKSQIEIEKSDGLSEASGLEALVRVLVTMRDRMLELGEDDYFDPRQLILDFAAQRPQLSEKSCLWMAEGLNSSRVVVKKTEKPEENNAVAVPGPVPKPEDGEPKASLSLKHLFGKYRDQLPDLERKKNLKAPIEIHSSELGTDPEQSPPFRTSLGLGSAEEFQCEKEGQAFKLVPKPSADNSEKSARKKATKKVEKSATIGGEQ